MKEQQEWAESQRRRPAGSETQVRVKRGANSQVSVLFLKIEIASATLTYLLSLFSDHLKKRVWGGFLGGLIWLFFLLKSISSSRHLIQFVCVKYKMSGSKYETSAAPRL